MAKQEIERKFRLAEAPRLREKDGVEITQGYLVMNGAELRVRRAGRKCYLTVKGDGDDVRDEWEKRIPQWVFELLWPHTEGRRVAKRRYTTRDGFEIDVYSGPLEGLVVLECEFDSKREAKRFELPKKYADAREVTNEPAYRNRNLATARKPPRR